MTYGIKIISTLDYQERGIRKGNECFIAVNGSTIHFFKTLGGAVRCFAKQGYNSFGEKL